MTFEEASQIYYINLEIKALRLELAKLKEERRYYKPNVISDMPRGGGEYINQEDEYLAKEQELEDMLNYSLRKLQYERRKIEEFLDTVGDAETRLILRLRCVNNMKWEDIGDEIGADRRTVSRKFYKFFEKNKSCPQCP